MQDTVDVIANVLSFTGHGIHPYLHHCNSTVWNNCSSNTTPVAFYKCLKQLTHWGWDKRAAIFQNTFSNAFSWMKMYEFRLRFRWSWFPGVPLTILIWSQIKATSNSLNFQKWPPYWCKNNFWTSKDKKIRSGHKRCVRPMATFWAVDRRSG